MTDLQNYAGDLKFLAVTARRRILKIDPYVTTIDASNYGVDEITTNVNTKVRFFILGWSAYNQEAVSLSYRFYFDGSIFSIGSLATSSSIRLNESIWCDRFIIAVAPVNVNTKVQVISLRVEFQ